MPQTPSQEFLAQPYRVHSFLADVPLHDVWTLDLPALREGITLQEFRRSVRRLETASKFSLPARVLFRLRFLLGRIFGWDEEPKEAPAWSFAKRLTAQDRERSAVSAGTPDGIFHVVYSFENELLLEVINRTVHAAAWSALERTPAGYRFFLAIYVRKLRWITPVYMALIDPFRRWVVYPALLKQLQRSWTEAFAPGATPGATE